MDDHRFQIELFVDLVNVLARKSEQLINQPIERKKFLLQLLQHVELTSNS